MKITIVGSGYVGLVAGACFAEMGNNITMLDVDSNKIESLQRGEIPIYEPGLAELIAKNLKLGSLVFTCDKSKAYSNAEIIFIAVGTPMGEDGSADLSYVLAAAKDIARYISGYTIIVDKSTVPVGSAQKVRKIILSNLADKSAIIDIVSNPEFLKEGVALQDFMSPDRVVIGSDSPKALNIMSALYKSFVLKNNRIITMSLESAEMTKYAANAMLATKISFINEMSQICEQVGADINDVRLGIGSDSRIGYSFIYPGCGYGGSCFPKDVRALCKTFEEHNAKSRILKAVEEVNAYQKTLLARKIIKRFGTDSIDSIDSDNLNEDSSLKANLKERKFCLWGLAFKPQTDDIREASSIELIKILLSCGAQISAYDPKAMPNMKALYPQIKYYDDKYEALKNADALVLVTEWKEFRNPDFTRIIANLKNPIIFDGRNIYRYFEMEGFEYYFIGGKAIKKVYTNSTR